MRIVTYNTHGGIGTDGKRSVRRIAETLAPYAPDVVCLQEQCQYPDPFGKGDHPGIVAARLTRNAVFQRNLDYLLGGYGNATLFSGTQPEIWKRELPSGKEQRGALELRLRNIGGLRSLTVFNTHWGLDPEERKAQAQALASWVNVAPRPVILAGDLNETLEGDALQLLLSLTGLIDAGAASNLPTYPTTGPASRIDYLLHSPDLRLLRLETLSSSASDHLALLGDFEI